MAGPMSVRRSDEVAAATMAEEAYTQLRRWILDGELPAGSRLVVRPLAERMGHSPTPVKAALVTLAQEGLVESVLNAGYSVPRADAELFRQSAELLVEYDVIAARAVVQQGRNESVAQELAGLVAEQGRSSRSGDNSRGFELELHAVLWQRSGNRLLLDAALTARGRALVSSGQLIRHPSLLGDLHAEHQSVVHALARGQIRAVERTLRRHGRNTITAVLDLFPDNRPRSTKGPR
ncbi:hypothetical protein CGZ94_15885 [Enemella evansiae]|uniref:HTH gntR-type domain-containing protein n=2 Tax=Enemella evansiae TaxID=2016499 RepID=A0A255G3L3_9ACTN|nr:hypothetical protein CGZ94_15885 [Enemella evansiae]